MRKNRIHKRNRLQWRMSTSGSVVHSKWKLFWRKMLSMTTQGVFDCSLFSDRRQTNYVFFIYLHMIPFFLFISLLLFFLSYIQRIDVKRLLLELCCTFDFNEINFVQTPDRFQFRNNHNDVWSQQGSEQSKLFFSKWT